MEKTKIDRINELAHKSKLDGLTDDEKDIAVRLFLWKYGEHIDNNKSDFVEPRA